MIARRTCPFVTRVLLQAVLVAPLFVAHTMLFAQGTGATVTGLITDSTGATLPNASVTFTNVATGAVSKVDTNGQGIYRVSGLLPGTYNATATMTGFKTSVREGVDLQIEAQVTLDYSLNVGAASDVVTVNADSSILETTSPTISQVIEGRQVQDTPLNGRNTMNLVTLTPGVVPQGGTSGAASNNSNGGAFTNANSFGNYQIAGGLAGQSSVYLDGAPLNVLFANSVTFVVTQDAVQEFRVESSVVNPQYGQFGGGVVSFGTKPGGNRLHGTLYEYFRNTIFNANNFFNNQFAIGRPKFNQNQFGATIGGPIMKDKVFFFISYEGYRLAQGVINQGRVPTQAELNGDFTADPKISNPVTGQQVQCGGVLNKFCIGAPVNSALDTVADPTSQYLANTIHYFPLPNKVTVPGAAVNYQADGKANARNAQETIRFDYNLNAKNKLFARYTRFDRTQDPTVFINNPVGPSAFTGVGSTVSQFAFGDTVTLSQSSVLDVRLSYLRYFSYLQPANTNANLAPLDNGDQAQFWNPASKEISPYFPALLITNNITYPYAGVNQTAQQPFNVYTAFANYTKVLGKHSLTGGGEFRQEEGYEFNQPFVSGAFAFAGTSTACIPSATHACPGGIVIPGSGATPVADFISGVFAAAPVGFTTTTNVSTLTHYAGFFFNDTYQVSPKLTATAGVRYELPGSFYEKNDRNAVILPQLANPLVLVNSLAYGSRGDLQAHHTLFSPRVGFSFAPYAGTTLRAGYSLAYLPQDSSFTSQPYYSSLNSPVTFVAPSSRLCAPLGFATTGKAPGNPCNSPGSVAKTTIIEPMSRAAYAANPAIFYGQTITGREPFSSFPYLQQWNANVQQAFGKSTVLQLAYLGARGDHLPITGSTDINQLPDSAIVGPPATTQGERPYPLFQNVNVTSPYVGDSTYHSAQVTLSKRFASGGTLLGNYSWSKFLGDSESTNGPVETHVQGVIQDYTNLRGEKSYLSFDVPQRLVISYILDLPVGRGKRYLGDAGSALNAAVSGWNVSGINLFQSGFPLAFTGAPNVVSAAYGAGTPRPNVALGCQQKNPISYVTAAQQQASIINKACFSTPVAGATAGSYFGNQPRTSGSFRTQGTDNWDFSIGKTTPIHEDINLVFRAEAFNVTNRVQFADPGLTVGTATFGVLTSQANQPRSFQFSLRANY